MNPRPLPTAHGDFRILCLDGAEGGRNVFPVSIYGGRPISCWVDVRMAFQRWMSVRLACSPAKTMEPRHYVNLRVFADYNQFYIWDPDLSGQQAPEDWSELDVVSRIKAAEGVVVICPDRNMEVPVEVSVFDGPPEFLPSAWNHIAEAPLRVESGVIEVAECTGGTLARITVGPGDYTVRALFRGLGTSTEDGLDGQDPYFVHLWPAHCPKVSVIRQWEP